VLWYPTQAKTGLEWGTQLSLPVSKLIIPLEPNVRRIQMKKHSWGFAPSFSAHVRSGEHGAPVQFP
jgi:hypothetical protein